MVTEFGEYLKKLRNDRKLTLRNVEEQVHISNAYLSQIERGKRGIPTQKTLTKLAKVYGVPVSDLTNKAQEEINKAVYAVQQIAQARGESDIPAPDTEFICRAYENLSNANKLALMSYLQYLKNDEIGKLFNLKESQ